MKTICPNCGALLVERWGLQTLSIRLTRERHCPNCNLPISIAMPEQRQEK